MRQKVYDKLISVIVPVYNVEEYLPVCIDSLINQSYFNIEIIMVDDGSTDDSGIICDQYAAMDNRIIVLHKANGGLSDARNAGLAHAHGHYIGFVDSDDWIDPNMYLELYHAIEQNNCEIAVCNMTVVDGKRYFYQNGDNSIQKYKMQDALRLLLENKELSNHVWNKLYIREIFTEKFPVGKYYEDVFIMHKVFEKSQSVAFVKKPLYFYRQRENSIVNMHDIAGVMDCLEALANRYSYYEGNSDFQALISDSMLSIIFKGMILLNSWGIGGAERKRYMVILNQYYSAYCKKKVKPISVDYLKRGAYTYFRKTTNYLHQLKYSSPSRIIIFLRYVKSRYQNKRISEYDKNTLGQLRKNKGKRKVVLMGSTEGSNLGDLAIAYSIKLFFNTYFKEYGYYELSEKFVKWNIRKIKRYIDRDDVLVLIGGGNFGDFYMDQQQIRLSVVRHFSSNPIVQFPQSFLFTETEIGKKQLALTQLLLNRAKNFVLFARETFSCNLFKQCMENVDIRLVPDIVLSNDFATNRGRNGILVCLRGDVESILDISERNQIMYTCMRYGNIICWDTYVSAFISLAERDAAVINGITFVSKHNLIVTDRFHGIIFAAITGTPCIAISNANQKIKGIMKLLENVHSIKLIKNLEQLDNAIEELLRKYPDGSDERISSTLFEPLRSCLLEMMHEGEK